MLNYKEKPDSKSSNNAIGNKNKPNSWLKKVSVSMLACTLALLVLMPMLHADVPEFGPAIVGEAVRGTKEIDPKLLKPTINNVAIGAKEVTGNGLQGANRRKRSANPCKIHVTVIDENGVVVETKTFSIGPTEKQPTAPQWSVTLDNPVQKGYKIVAQQELDGKFSNESDPYVVKELLSTKYDGKLTMPELKVWSEDLFVLESDAIEDIENTFKEYNKNVEIDGKKTFDKDLSKIDVAGNGKNITVTFTDNSSLTIDISDKVTVKKITEPSTAPIIDTLKVVDSKITGKVDLTKVAAPKRLRVEIVTNFGQTKPEDFCTDQGCSIDKGTKAFATVNPETGEFSYDIGNNNVELGKNFGVIVKEYRKKNNCGTIQPELVIPNVPVRDPKKLTDTEKDKIRDEIRKANTTPSGKSKLPDGTGFNDHIKAYIDIDDEGNVKIYSGNDVEGKIVDGTFVPDRDENGNVKVKTGKENNEIPIEPKNLLKNLPPLAPEVALSKDKKNITITPNLELDTDAKTIAVSYKDKDGKDQRITATKADDGTWSITEGEGTVDANGFITLEISKVKGGTTVTATVTDKGGIADDDKQALESDAAEFKLTKAVLVEALGGLDPVVMKKWVKDKVDWKDGVKAKDSATEENKAKIKEILDEKETKFTDEDSRGTTDEGDFKGKVKVTFDDGSLIEVENQMLYVSDPVSPSDKENLPDDALDVELKLGEGVKAGDKVGNKETPVTAKAYKVKPGTDLSTEKVSKTEKTCFEDVGATVSDDTYVDVTWNDKDKGTNFKATAENNVFTATATKKFKVTVQANGGTGDDKVEYKKNGESFTLPAKDTFTPPDNQEFKTWEVDSKEVAPGTEITVEKDTVIKAIWKDIMVNVSYNANGGSGEMKGATQKKGSKYTLPENNFKAPDENQEFKAWEVNGKEVAAGTEITLDKDTEIKAIWKDIMVNVSYNANGGSGEMKGATQKKGSKYTLPENSFKAPDENQEFKAWEVNGNEISAGTEITLDKDTEIKAIWKPIELKVKFQTEAGATGSMEEQIVNKGSKYELPKPTFTPDKGKEFAGWKIEGQDGVKKAGEKIDNISGDITLTATWKDIEYKVTFNGNTGTGSMDPATVKKGEKYKLPENSFGAPSDKQEFKTWEVNGKEVAPGTEITVEKDTEVKAIWREKSSTPGTPDTPKPNPDKPSVTEREGGKDRIDTSILISKQQYKKARTVIIVRNDLYPDALTAGLLGKVKPAPILLTPSKMLDPRVEAEIRRLGATEIIIVGGKSAISLDVEKALAAYDSDTVERLDGIDRYETATLVARKVAGLVDIRQTAIITTGENWPDALSASAFACKNNHPILLVRKNKIDQVVNRTMKDLKIGQVYVVGGPMAVSETVAKKLPKVITRIAGLNRYGTAKAVAEYGFKDAKGLYLASGEVYADALIIGPVAGQRNVPILLTQHKHLNAETKAYIEAHKPGWTTIVGGTRRIGPEVEKELKK